MTRTIEINLSTEEFEVMESIAKEVGCSVKEVMMEFVVAGVHSVADGTVSIFNECCQETNEDEEQEEVDPNVCPECESKHTGRTITYHQKKLCLDCADQYLDHMKELLIKGKYDCLYNFNYLFYEFDKFVSPKEKTGDGWFVEFIEFKKIIDFYGRSRHGESPSRLMTEMEQLFKIPMLRDDTYEQEFPLVMKIYREISDSRFD